MKGCRDWKSAKTLKGGVVAVGVMTNDMVRDLIGTIGTVEGSCTMARGPVVDHNGLDWRLSAVCGGSSMSDPLVFPAPISQVLPSWTP